MPRGLPGAHPSLKVAETASGTCACKKAIGLPLSGPVSGGDCPLSRIGTLMGTVGLLPSDVLRWLEGKDPRRLC